MASESEIIIEARKRLQGGGKERVLLWQTSLRTAINAPGFLDANAAEFASLVLETLPTYVSRAQQRAVLSAIRLALPTSEPFLKAFAAALLKASAAAGPRPPHQTAFSLLEWISLVLSYLGPEAKKAAGKLLEAAAALLDASLPDSTSERRATAVDERRWHAAALTIGKLLRTKPALLPDALEVAEGAKGAGGGLVRAVLEAVARVQGAAGDEARKSANEALLPVFCDRVVSARERPAPAVVASYRPMLASLSTSDVAEKLLPPLNRSLKRTPEAAMGALAAMLVHVRADLSGQSIELLPLLLAQARAKEAARPLAMEAVSALAARVADASALGQLVSIVAGVLDGSSGGGKVRAAGERAALALALAALADAPAGAADAAAGAGTAGAAGIENGTSSSANGVSGSSATSSSASSATSTSSAEHRAVAAKAVEAICTAYKDEPTEEPKLALLTALGHWLPRCDASAPPASAVALLAAGLKDGKEAIRRGHLGVLVGVVRTAPAMCGAFGALAGGLAKVIGDGLAKATLRGEGVAALLVAVHVAAADARADKELEASGTWSSATAATSALLLPATAAKLSPSEAASAAELAAALPVLRGARLPAGTIQASARLLTLTLLHRSPEPRQAATTAAQTALSQNSNLLTPLLEALLHWMGSEPGHGAAAGVLSDVASGGEDPVKAPIGAFAHSFGLALVALVPSRQQQGQQQQQQGEQQQQQQQQQKYEGEQQGQQGEQQRQEGRQKHKRRQGQENGQQQHQQHQRHLSADEVALLALAAHHPAISAGVRDGTRAWKAVGAHLPNLAADIAGCAPQLVAVLCSGPLGLASTSPPQRTAAMLALGSATHAAPDFLLPALLPELKALLARTEHDALSALDVAVWGTPEGLLASEAASGGAAFSGEGSGAPAASAAVPAARGASASARGGGGRGGRGGRGGKDTSGTSREQEFRERRLAEEAQVRARVNAIRAKLELGLATMAAVARAAPGATADALPELAPMCLPLLASPIVGLAAFDAVRALSSCMPPPLGARSLLLAASLRLVTLAGMGASSSGSSGSSINGFIGGSSSGATPVSYSELPSRSSVADVVHALAAATADKRPLQPAAYAFVFPVLRAVLHCPRHTPLHDEALGVVALHVRPELDVPRAESLELLYHLLGIIPAYRERVLPLLRALCTGVTDTELPAAAAGLLAAAPHVRAAALAALPGVPSLAEGLAPSEAVAVVLWVGVHDVSAANAEAALALWQQAHCTLKPSSVQLLVPHLASPAPDVRAATAAALSSALQQHPSAVPAALQLVVSLYDESADVAVRQGVAAALKACAKELGDRDVAVALDFLIGRGLADENEGVRALMVAAGSAVVDAQGDSHAQSMLPLFEGYLERDASSNGAGSEARYDLVREGVVVLLGTLAAHLAPGDAKRRSIMATLVEVLSTPSESVQRAVSSCLPPLMGPLASDRPYVEGLLAQLMAKLKKPGASYGERRGAAFGVAGVVKGLGISSLKGYGVMDSLRALIEDKKDAKAREGGLLAFECLVDKLGRLFEPYVIHVLPLLLNCFGDMSPQVRQATDDAARAIMGQLTASGVKLVLPALLKGLEDNTWRTKQGSIQLLGAMAYCAPKQLGTCLPLIVPRLSGVLGDPHPKVQAAAKESLDEIGSVIRNPEVASLVPALLLGISDPNSHTRPCLDTLLATTFINTIDAPSLALIVPVVHRGLRDRSGDTKKRAARIVGSMCSLVNDPRDMTPYVPLLMPELQKALVDPLPEVRATAARAMGSLLRGMGPTTLGDLLPWLLSALRSEGSSVERSGAAQGLAEVLAVLGEGHLVALLPELLAGARSRNAFVREGHLTLFRYLPMTLADAFQHHLGTVLPIILEALSDEAEGVRDAALAAGRTFVDTYAQSCLPLLLPAVEAGIFHASWRIRQSSLELCGELLFKVAGTSGKVKLDGGSDDEGAAHEGYGAAIMAALGEERRNEVLAALYIARSDVQYTVRNAALHVWKTVVVNTPRTLQEVLPSLMQLVIDSLADEGEDRRTAAARCLGELVRKMGERILTRIIPILRDGMSDPSASTRQGVCLGLKEVLDNVSRHQLGDHLADVLAPVQAALCDVDAGVREAAGAAFGALFKGGGGGAVDNVVPSLLAGLDGDEASYSASLEGLRVIMGVRPSVFNGAVPKLLRAPVTGARLRALGALAGVAGGTLHHHLPNILSTTLALMSTSDTTPPAEAAPTTALQACIAAGEEGAHLVVAELLKSLEDPARRKGAADLAAAYAKASRVDLQEHVDPMLGALVLLLVEEDEVLSSAGWKALEALAATVPKDEQADHVDALKEAIATAREKERRKRKGGPLRIGGLCGQPRALAPLLPFYLQGVLQGASADVREAAAEGLGELVDVVSEEALKPFVVMITGPLIRIIGDRFPSSIKAAILTTLGLLVGKAGPGLKPFVPQLQTTFLKCLNDTAANVRARAASNLGELTRLSARVDQLASDLANSASSAPDASSASAFLAALRGTLVASGSRLTAPVLSKVGDVLASLLQRACAVGTEDSFRPAVASTLGAYAAHCSQNELEALLSGPVGPLGAGAAAGAWEVREGSAMLLAAVGREAGAKLEEGGLLRSAVEAAVKFSKDSQVPVKVAGGRAAARLFLAARNTGPALTNVMTTLLGPDQSSETQRQALLALTSVATADAEALQPHLPALLPSVCSLLTREPTSVVKAAAEQLLKKALNLSSSEGSGGGGGGIEIGQAAALASGGVAKSFLTDAYLRRLQKLAEDEWQEVEEY